jgi:hypothetical protein
MTAATKLKLRRALKGNKRAAGHAINPASLANLEAGRGKSPTLANLDPHAAAAARWGRKKGKP